jgi:hypothetical protein
MSQKEEQTIDCETCCETITKENKQVKCPNNGCKLDCCSNCIQQYIESKKMSIPVCMECHNNWNDAFIRSVCSKQWVEKKYNLLMKNVLLEEQKSFIGDTMSIVEIYKDLQNSAALLKEIQGILDQHIKEERSLMIEHELFMIKRRSQGGETQEQVRYNKELTDKIRNKRNMTSYLNKVIERISGWTNNPKKIVEDPQNMRYIFAAELRTQVFERINKEKVELKDFNSTFRYRNSQHDDEEPNQDNDVERLWREAQERHQNEEEEMNKKHIFKRPCVKENCLGVVNGKGQCGVCKTIICLDCSGIKTENEEHKCDPEELKTIEELKKSAKPCPKCGWAISKVLGCDHMFCTHCKTGFSWNTGKLISDRHNTNPYFYEFRNRRNQSLAQEINTSLLDCNDRPIGATDWFNGNGGLILEDMNLYKQGFNHKDEPTTYYQVWKKYQKWMREMNHLIETTTSATEYEPVNIHHPDHNKYNRLRYVLKEIPESTFTTQLMREYKNISYETQQQQLLTMFHESLIDWRNGLRENAYDPEAILLTPEMRSIFETKCVDNYQAIKNIPFLVSRRNLESFRSLHSLEFYQKFNWKLPLEIIRFYNRESWKLFYFYGYSQFKFIQFELPNESDEDKVDFINETENPCWLWEFSFKTLKCDKYDHFVCVVLKSIFQFDQDFINEWIPWIKDVNVQEEPEQPPAKKARKSKKH